MGWKIKFNYDAGNSFGREPDQEDFIGTLYIRPYEWDDELIARKALHRLKEHYLWQDSLNATYGMTCLSLSGGKR